MIFNQIISRILKSKATTLYKNILPLFSAGFLAMSVVEGLVWILALLLTSCSSIRRVEAIPIETINEVLKTDTIYINNVQYDSIYVSQDKFIDRTKDTLLIRQHDVEYRYKLLRDTIYKTKIEILRDSIPYEVRITEIKEVKHIPPWIKPFALIGTITVLVLLIYIFTKLKRF